VDRDGECSDRPPAELELTRRGLLAGAALGAAALASVTPAGAAVRRLGAEKPRSGGKLRVAMSGISVTEVLDPNAAVSEQAACYATNMFDRLVRLDEHVRLQNELAESFEPNKDASAWTVRLRQGVHWHDGAPLVAEDLLFTLRRMGAPKSTLFGKSVADYVNLPAMRKLDARTVRLPLKTPYAEFPTLFTPPQMQIVKNGETTFKHPIGTGPFEFVSWTPGRSASFKKNPHYWKPGRPYVDELEITGLGDPTARVNALLNGEVDAITEIPFVQAKAQQKAGNIKLLIANGPNMVPMYMAVDLEPFRDVRVRQAMRLIADRPGLIQTAQLGLGTLGNDVPSKGLPDYDTALPQRHQDIDQAKFLLKKAGKADLKVTLYSSTAGPGMLESATAYAEQAKKAGVTINVNNGPADSYFGPKYLKLNFAQSLWLALPLVSFFAQAVAGNAPFNETHWHNAKWDALFRQTQRTLNPTKRKDLYFELQKMLWEEGGYIIWGFYPDIDGLAKNVHAVPNPVNELSNFSLRDFWLS
jgi:peptide/nickel transport system substrate-binding protein